MCMFFRKYLYFDMPNSLGGTETEIQTKNIKHWQIRSPYVIRNTTRFGFFRKRGSLIILNQSRYEAENNTQPQNLTLMIVV